MPGQYCCEPAQGCCENRISGSLPFLFTEITTRADHFPQYPMKKSPTRRGKTLLREHYMKMKKLILKSVG